MPEHPTLSNCINELERLAKELKLLDQLMPSKMLEMLAKDLSFDPDIMNGYGLYSFKAEGKAHGHESGPSYLIIEAPSRIDAEKQARKDVDDPTVILTLVNYLRMEQPRRLKDLS